MSYHNNIYTKLLYYYRRQTNDMNPFRSPGEIVGLDINRHITFTVDNYKVSQETYEQQKQTKEE